MNRIRLTRHILSLLILSLFLAHAANVIQLPLLVTLEKKAYDFRINLNHITKPDQRIVIVDIDETSLEKIGRWPWSRNILAQLVDNLFDYYYVNVAGFDVLFAETDNSSGLDVLEQFALGPMKSNHAYQQELEKVRPSLKFDEVFARSLRGRNVILGYYFTQTTNSNKKNMTVGQLPDPVYLLDDNDAKIPFVRAQGYGASLSILQQNANHGGFIDLPTVDSDGVIRAIPMVQRYGDVLYESLSMAMVRSIMDFPPLELQIADDYHNAEVNLGLEQMQLGSFRIPVNERGVAMVPYRGPFGSFPYISAVDVLSKAAPKESLEDAIVLVGTTAAGLLDVRSTPVQNLYPGVEVHANLIAGILDGDIKQNPAYLQGVLFVSLILIWVILSLLFHASNMFFFILGLSLLFAATFAGGVIAWNEFNIVLPMATQLAFITLLFIYFVTYSYFVENRSKRQLAKVFRQYIPPELVDELGGEAGDYGMEGETRDMTVMFSDIRGFTSLSESLPPKELTRLMNTYFSGMTAALQKNRGTIDKYIGDAIMAFWGAPIADEKHMQRAVDAAMDMVKTLELMQDEFKRQGWPKISIGVGINSGPMYVGNIGSKFRMSYTALGDAVNLGSRLEALTKRYGVTIIVSETTKACCFDYLFREIDRVRVMGKTEPVTIFEPIGKKDSVIALHKKLLSDYQLALDYYRQRQWINAQLAFRQLMDTDNHPLYQVYIDRCSYFIDHPVGEEWDGVYNYDSK